VAIDESEVRQTVCDGGYVLTAAGQSDLIWGHVSARDPAGRGVWMKPAGLGFEEVEAEDALLVSPAGEVLRGSGRRHIEYAIHTEVLSARPDAGAVVHTHAESSIAFAALGVPLRPLSHDGVLVVPPDLARFTGTAGLIQTSQLGQDLARSLGARNAVLIPGHGVVTVGPDVLTAVMTAVLLDRACRVQLSVEAAGGPATWTSDEESLRKRAECWPRAQLEAGYAYLLRQAATRRLHRVGRSAEYQIDEGGQIGSGTDKPARRQ
jgi:ribulose-5-phosphate 4-epimerase/fuculose-1-phosphate aldolase